ncbi:DUF6958 family protein [Pseudaminobacter sp. NGMCC 1.201702]|uniref:DUF6958 family protein n=1 Tax=Pseudaminobacter sp. NGMCC 1.201702 TaxID=3391825 RepID=UPI0039EED6CF
MHLIKPERASRALWSGTSQLQSASLPSLVSSKAFLAAPFLQAKTAGWWLKAVQLDLEAKGIISRAPGKPVRLYRRPRAVA